MDKYAFAELISYITALPSSAHLGECQCREIEALMDRCSLRRAVMSVDDLLKHMQAGSKIEAIKAYRALTNQGLKESKDAVERYWSAPAKTEAA